MDSGVVLDAGWGGLRRRSSLFCVAELASMVSSFLFPADLCDLCHSRAVREARTSFSPAVCALQSGAGIGPGAACGLWDGSPDRSSADDRADRACDRVSMACVRAGAFASALQYGRDQTGR